MKYNRTGTQGTPALTPPLPVPRSDLRLQKSEVTKKKLVESLTGWDKFGQMMRELRNDQSCPSPPTPPSATKPNQHLRKDPDFFSFQNFLNYPENGIRPTRRLCVEKKICEDSKKNKRTKFSVGIER